MKDLLGGTGSGLAAMSNLDLPVPPGFTTTDACRAYMEAGDLPDGLMESVAEYMRELEEATGKSFGDPEDPLLVSVRNGAVVSMPGMMDTVLNLGLNDTAVGGLARRTDDGRFAYDSYCHFIQIFGEVVLKVENERFEADLQDLKEERGVEEDPDLSAEDLQELIETYKKMVEEEADQPFPGEAEEQLAIRAVFDSWQNDWSVAYRKEYGIPDDLGTAVTVMVMVFNNMGEDSATRVAFTRDPSTGDQGLFGEFL